MSNAKLRVRRIWLGELDASCGPAPKLHMRFV
ncbi:MAG: hypothetical protein K0R38_3634 [Polyangiaceae bacterium]|jgi:hypothetical protein|nr:hypothetical protein [Polyangiaceae bacterium]